MLQNKNQFTGNITSRSRCYPNRNQCGRNQCGRRRRRRYGFCPRRDNSYCYYDCYYNPSYNYYCPNHCPNPPGPNPPETPCYSSQTCTDCTDILITPIQNQAYCNAPGVDSLVETPAIYSKKGINLLNFNININLNINILIYILSLPSSLYPC